MKKASILKKKFMKKGGNSGKVATGTILWSKTFKKKSGMV